MPVRNAAKALIINKDKILLNKCINGMDYPIGNIQPNEIYYDLPGGGQNQYETIEETIKRECLEETGYRVIVKGLVALYEEIYVDSRIREDFPDYAHKLFFVFLCNLTDEPINAITEMDKGQIDSEWIDIKELSSINLNPIILKDNIQSILISEVPVFLGSKHIL